MKTKLMISLLVVCSAIAAVAASDPVLMTINGKEIKLSEFEYLYQKNQQQQVDKETLDQYVDRFVTYKRKVADAEAAGLDTTAAFKKELEGYRNDIVSQYLVDSTAIEPLIQQSYERMKTFVNVTTSCIIWVATMSTSCATRHAWTAFVASWWLANRGTAWH